MNRLNLAAALKSIATEYDHKVFKWSIPSNCPIQIPKTVKTEYDRNVFLKENLHLRMTNDTTLDCHYWAIRDWGGIKSFKRSPKNDLRMQTFLAELGTGSIARTSFECISSLSKVASFLFPHNYAIYDSRVIYALNWLLLLKADAKEFFPQPIGRSTELAKYDMQTILRLSGRHQYRTQKTAFHEYCRLMQDMSTEVFGIGSKPYLAEMLLFAIAPTWVVQSIKKSVSLSVAKDA